MSQSCEQVRCSAVDVQVKDYSYDWVIKNYGPRYRNIPESVVESPPIIFDIDPQTEWVLRLRPHNDEIDIIEVCLKKGLPGSNICAVLSILNTNKINNVMKTKEKKLGGDWSDNKQVDYYAVKYKKLQESLSDGVLIVRLKLIYHFLTASDSNCSINEQKNKLSEFDGFKKLFDDKEHSDAHIIVGDQVIDVHKCILSARSEYFSTEFKKCWEESGENKVEVTDFSHKIMQEVLRFIYTDKVNEMDNLKIDLLRASDKYLIDDLKILCEEALIKDLKIKNILDMLKLADKYNAINLREEGLKFFKIHKKEITTSENFKTAIQKLGLPASITVDLIKQ